MRYVAGVGMGKLLQPSEHDSSGVLSVSMSDHGSPRALLPPRASSPPSLGPAYAKPSHHMQRAEPLSTQHPSWITDLPQSKLNLEIVLLIRP